MEGKARIPEAFPIVVAIELGVKFAKVSYALRKNKEVMDIVSWPRCAIHWCKTPTVSLYKKNSTEFVARGYRALQEKAKPGGERHELLRDLILPLDERTQATAFVNGITPLQAITDYLRALQEYVMAKVLLGKMGYSPADFQYVFTYPHHWTNRAKDTILQAAIGVGLVKAGNPPNRVIFLSEHNAIANYCEQSTDRIQFGDKDHFMICDARDSEGLHLVVHEVHKNSDGQVQGLMIVGQCYTEECAGLDIDIEIGDLDDDFDDGYLVFSAAELKEYVFEPAAKNILKLIRDLLQQEHQGRGGCRAIFMVGEFGASQYLSDRVRQEFKGQVELVAVPTRQELAITRVVSSGMVASSQGQRQGGGYISGPAFNPMHSNGVGSGGARLVGGGEVAIGVVGPSANNNSTGNGARPLRYAQPSQPVPAAGLDYSYRPQELRSVQSHPHSVKYSENFHAVMAIDFGTKFTKVSCAVKKYGYASDIHDVTFWVQDGYWSDKTPTESLYMKGSTDIHEWGYWARKAAGEPKVKDNCCLLSNLKLHLDDTMEMPPFMNGLSPMKAISDYLNRVHEHSIEDELKKNPGLNRSHFQYYLTVPSHWSDRAKYTMRQAALGTGMVKASDVYNRLVLLSEHDAMAYYCERTADQGQFKDKDRFIICTAGESGGVDVIVYEVNETPSGMVRHLRVGHSHGAGCGSDILEGNMLTLLERKHRKYRGEIAAKGWQLTMEERWEIIRAQFDGVEDVIILLAKETGLENLVDYDLGIEEGYFVVPALEMKEEVFEPVLSDVVELIKESLQHTGERCAALFMLGDFGPCPYIWERVRQECKDLVELVATPSSQSMALVYGALYAGLDSDKNV
ncbi:hypothetical protein BGW39_006036 [Mortierella sp. 14UC]|nr:hypothetical protein BGW39_006036 [Mortierella sp. 14UC]